MKVVLLVVLFGITAIAGFAIGQQDWELGKVALVGVAVLLALIGAVGLIAARLRSAFAVGSSRELPRAHHRVS